MYASCVHACTGSCSNHSPRRPSSSPSISTSVVAFNPPIWPALRSLTSSAPLLLVATLIPSVLTAKPQNARPSPTSRSIAALDSLDLALVPHYHVDGCSLVDRSRLTSRSSNTDRKDKEKVIKAKEEARKNASSIPSLPGTTGNETLQRDSQKALSIAQGISSDNSDGWRQRTLMVMNLPGTMRDEASIRRYFEEFMRPDDDDSLSHDGHSDNGADPYYSTTNRSTRDTRQGMRRTILDLTRTNVHPRAIMPLVSQLTVTDRQAHSLTCTQMAILRALSRRSC